MTDDTSLIGEKPGWLRTLCRRALRPGGIAYISYNTLPGWRMRGLTRDLLEWHL